MTRHWLRVDLLLALSLCAMTGVASRSRAAQPPLRFEVAELFLELNDTDGDLGIHSLIDGGPWTRLSIDTPGDEKLFGIVTHGQLRQHGMTEVFFESAEPPFDELAPAVFFRRFPEGRYEVEGLSQDGREIASTATLSHILAAPPESISVSGIAAAKDCDAPLLPVVAPPVVLRWDPVTTHHPTLGRQGPVKVDLYEVVVESDDVKLSIELPPGSREMTVPAEVTAPGGEFKFEILVRTTTGNRTAVESCFIVSF